MKLINSLKYFFVSNYKDFLKGMALGAVMVVPGISGGTMAIVLGIYGKIISSIGDLFKFKKKNLIFLAVTGIGIFLGSLLFSNIIMQVMNYSKAFINYLFAGVVLGSLPLTIQQSQVTKEMLSSKGKTPLYITLFLLGAGVVIGLSFLWENLEKISMAHGFWGLVINLAAGFTTAVALVLPGISGSLFLKSIGLYNVLLSVLSFTSKVDWFFLSSFGISLFVGIFLTSKAVGGIFHKYRAGAFIAISGFLLGTVVTMLMDAAPKGIEILFCLLALVLGSAITLALYFISNSFRKRKIANSLDENSNLEQQTLTVENRADDINDN